MISHCLQCHGLQFPAEKKWLEENHRCAWQKGGGKDLHGCTGRKGLPNTLVFQPLHWRWRQLSWIVLLVHLGMLLLMLLDRVWALGAVASVDPIEKLNCSGRYWASSFGIAFEFKPRSSNVNWYHSAWLKCIILVTIGYRSYVGTSNK